MIALSRCGPRCWHSHPCHGHEQRFAAGPIVATSEQASPALRSRTMHRYLSPLPSFAVGLLAFALHGCGAALTAADQDAGTGGTTASGGGNATSGSGGSAIGGSAGSVTAGR